MAYLGVPYGIYYESKNNTPGITGIVAVVKRPDGAYMGAYPFVEVTNNSNFLGIYYFNFITSLNDPEGIYLVSINSPNEGNRSRRSIEISRRPDAFTDRFFADSADYNSTFVNVPDMDVSTMDFTNTEVCIEQPDFQVNDDLQSQNVCISNNACDTD